MSRTSKSEDVKQETATGRSDVRYSLHLLGRNPIVLVGTFIAIGSLILALASGSIVDPAAWKHTNLDLRLCWNNPTINWHINNVFDCSGKSYPLGTDSYGRNLLNMIVLALPIDLGIALAVVLSAIAIGILLGGSAAYAGGKLDELVLRVTDVFLAIPGILLAIVFLVVLGRNLTILTVAVLITWWPTYVRIMRSQILSEKEKPYVEALRAVGAGRPRILFKHILPNSVYPILVQGTLDVGSVILTVSALTFIGLSPSPLLPELGNLVNQGIMYVFTAPWLILFPGLTIFVVSLGFNLLGDGIRDIFDPRLRR